MIQALYTGATGMSAMQTEINVTANNIANVNTIGFKKSRPEFADLMYKVMQYAGTATSSTTNSPTGIEVGLGVRPSATTKIFTEGNLQKTGNQLDMAITGKGFFTLSMPNGTQVYSRNGAFKVDSNGNLVNADGYQLVPNITIPQDATSVSIGTDGTVSVIEPGQTQATQVGQITLTNFINPAGLHSMGSNIYTQTGSSGQPVQSVAGTNGLGEIRQGFVEMSNVKLVVALTDLITGQRAYDSNSKVITTSSQMLQTVNQLKQ